MTFFSSLVSRKILLIEDILPVKSYVRPHLTSLEVYLKKAYEKAFKDWIKKLKLCISVKGEYFEGLK